MERKNIIDYRLQFLRYLSIEKNYSDKTLLSYNNDLSKYIEFLKKYDINDITKINKNDVRAFFLFLREKELSNRTLGRYYSALNSFFRTLMPVLI